MIMGNYLGVGSVDPHVMAARSEPNGPVDEPPRKATVGMDHPTVVPVNFDDVSRDDDGR